MFARLNGKLMKLIPGVIEVNWTQYNICLVAIYKFFLATTTLLLGRIIQGIKELGSVDSSGPSMYRIETVKKICAKSETCLVAMNSK